MDLKECAKALCDKLKEIEKHPSYHAVFLQEANHGMPYNGPNYKRELEDLSNCIEKNFYQDRDLGDE